MGRFGRSSISDRFSLTDSIVGMDVSDVETCEIALVGRSIVFEKVKSPPEKRHIPPVFLQIMGLKDVWRLMLKLFFFRQLPSNVSYPKTYYLLLNKSPLQFINFLPNPHGNLQGFIEQSSVFASLFAHL